MEVANRWRFGFGGFRLLGFAVKFRIWDLGLVVQIYDLVVLDLVLVVGFVFGFSGLTLRLSILLPLESITHIFGLGFGFCYWVFFI